MSAYLIEWPGLPRRTAVEIDVPKGTDPLDVIPETIAHELDLFRFEVQIGDGGGVIRRLGEDSRGIAFTFRPVTAEVTS